MSNIIDEYEKQIKEQFTMLDGLYIELGQLLNLQKVASHVSYKQLSIEDEKINNVKSINTIYEIATSNQNTKCYLYAKLKKDDILHGTLITFYGHDVSFQSNYKFSCKNKLIRDTHMTYTDLLDVINQYLGVAL